MDYDPDPFMDDFEDDERVCLACLDDAGLRKAFGRSSAKEEGECNFCGSVKLIVAFPRTLHVQTEVTTNRKQRFSRY